MAVQKAPTVDVAGASVRNGAQIATFSFLEYMVIDRGTPGISPVKCPLL